jgi:hypothetical protein
MAHEHTHSSAEERQAYFLDQLCTIGICGALGAIMILLFRGNALSSILNPKFHAPVMWGGIALVMIVAVRALAVWFASAAPAHDHDHAHGDHKHDHEHEDCSHDHGHGHCDHDHGHEHQHAHAHDDHGHEHHDHSEHNHSHSPVDDHGHSHGFAPWRYAVLLLPVVLYFLNIPGRAGEEEKYADNIPTLDFKEVERAGATQDSRNDWEAKAKRGEKGRLKGKFFPMGNDMFRLMREKVTCCAADAVPLNVPLIAAEHVRAEDFQNRWVSVVGTVKFKQLPGSDEWHPYFEVEKEADIVKMKGPDPNPFVF